MCNSFRTTYPQAAAMKASGQGDRYNTSYLFNLAPGLLAIPMVIYFRKNNPGLFENNVLLFYQTPGLLHSNMLN